MRHLTFVSHFILCLAVAAGAFFAWRAGALAAIWAADKSRMTSAIAVLLIGTLVWLGVQAWRADAGGGVSPVSGRVWDKSREQWAKRANASFGHLAERLLPMLGLAGTVVGLSLEMKAISVSQSPLMAVGTALYCTGAGIIAAAIVAVATFNVERGVRQ
jgi:MotA/TolQ/ExbB proton channel family